MRKSTTESLPSPFISQTSASDIPMAVLGNNVVPTAPDDHVPSELNKSALNGHLINVDGLSIKKRPTNLSLKIVNEKNSISFNTDRTPTPTGNDTQTVAVSTSAAIGPTSKKSVKRHDIGFTNLSYTVKAGILRKETKQILQGINGLFKAGDLTAIMGPSGAGKSTLLNILSGYTTQNITGGITINGRQRDLKRFLHQSAYIMQDHEPQPHLTVLEAMYFSAHLKIGNEMCPASKKQRIHEILDAMEMIESSRTKTCNLSGGQKKRLSVALELVSNPPIMIFDEPTSGLDSSTSTLCVALLKKLAEDGRTIICTIHQPSALVFSMFDHLFAIAEGKCIFSGATDNVVPFLGELDLKCPEHYNPSDYLLEISTNDYGHENSRLTEKIENGNCENYRQTEQSQAQIEAMNHVERRMKAGLLTPVKAPNITLNTAPPLTPIMEVSSSIWGSKGILESTIFRSNKNQKIYKTQCKITKLKKDCKLKMHKPNLQIDPSKFCKKDDRYASSFWRQLYLLLMRTFLILWRNKSLTRNRLIIHFVMGVAVGVLYYGIGNEADLLRSNHSYIFFSIMFLMYTTFSSTILNFPLEFPVVAREHFNRWYSLRAYYVAITLADVPIQLGCNLIFIAVTYILTNQPLEFYRAALFYVMCLMSCLIAQSIGLVVGATFNLKNAAIFGPFFISPFLVFSGFFLEMRHAPSCMQWLFEISFLKHALEGSSMALFGFDRPKLSCSKIFCEFIRPKRFLKYLKMDDGSYLLAVLVLTVTFFFLRFVAFYIMSYRLKMRR